MSSRRVKIGVSLSPDSVSITPCPGTCSNWTDKPLSPSRLLVLCLSLCPFNSSLLRRRDLSQCSLDSLVLNQLVTSPHSALQESRPLTQNTPVHS
ncbi:Uncharacterized protein DAT39_021865 [Clarias magur]|uniref:Uncharacterized protein n=1 Tax=Clarias magur TaxID=1594786 RepID=A0A8J4TE74_CLAMG|nr:Uncharacterized protein DAT39_021865 [Clarias magur]